MRHTKRKMPSRDCCSDNSLVREPTKNTKQRKGCNTDQQIRYGEVYDEVVGEVSFKLPEWIFPYCYYYQIVSTAATRESGKKKNAGLAAQAEEN